MNRRSTRGRPTLTAAVKAIEFAVAYYVKVFFESIPNQDNEMPRIRKMYCRPMTRDSRNLRIRIGRLEDRSLGRDTEIFDTRGQKFDEARQRRAGRRQAARLAEQRTGEEARQEVQEGANEHLLVCVNAK